VQTTACAYCAVGCGYKVYTWPVGAEGGPTAKENVFGADFPAGFESVWVSPNQYTTVLIGGKPHHCVVVPDFDATVVNPGGNHSIRGGTLALKCYTPTGPTKDRLQFPQVRVGGKLVRVS
jgi:arsenite oxidase large subunit